MVLGTPGYPWNFTQFFIFSLRNPLRIAYRALKSLIMSRGVK
jgi:hypothetical protein